MNELDGHVIIVTGGAKGQGRAHVELLAERGAKVVFGDIDTDAGKQLEAQLTELGRNATFVELDVSVLDDWVEALKTARSNYGEITGLVNNAGISISDTIDNFTVEGFQKVVAVNQLGVLNGLHVVGTALADLGRGAIVNTSSTLGAYASPVSIAYQGTKAAVRAFTKSAALDFGRNGVRVNVILPGLVDTDFIASHKKAGKGALNDSVARTPLGRIAEPREISEAVCFLLSDASSYINGAELTIDGGMTAGSIGSLQASSESGGAQ